MKNAPIICQFKDCESVATRYPAIDIFYRPATAAEAGLDSSASAVSEKAVPEKLHTALIAVGFCDEHAQGRHINEFLTDPFWQLVCDDLSRKGCPVPDRELSMLRLEDITAPIASSIRIARGRDAYMPDFKDGMKLGSFDIINWAAIRLYHMGQMLGLNPNPFNEFEEMIIGTACTTDIRHLTIWDIALVDAIWRRHATDAQVKELYEAKTEGPEIFIEKAGKQQAQNYKLIIRGQQKAAIIIPVQKEQFKKNALEYAAGKGAKGVNL
jgi:hypothetical protein